MILHQVGVESPQKVIWNKTVLKRGQWYGFDNRNRPCTTELFLVGNKVKIRVLDHGYWSDELISIYNESIPLYIRQQLIVKYEQYRRKRLRDA